MNETVNRGVPATTPTDGILRAGADLVDLTPRFDGPLAGFGPIDNGHARGFFGRLYASVLILDDGHGTRCALIAADLHAGSRWISETLGARLVDVGLHVSRVLIAGSHTHAGPARIYGNEYFDNNSGPRPMALGRPGFDRVMATHLVGALEAGVRTAVSRLTPARVGYGAAPADGLVINRSLDAVRNNPEAADLPGLARALVGGLSRKAFPEVDDPTPLHITDSRVHAVWAEATADGTAIGGFAVLGAHPTIGPRQNRVWSGDAFAVASAIVRRQAEMPICLAGGALGDSNLTLPPDTVTEAGQRLNRTNRRYDRSANTLFAKLLDWRKPWLGPAYDDRPRAPHHDLIALIGRRLASPLRAALTAAAHASRTPQAITGPFDCRLVDADAPGAPLRLQAADMTPIDVAELGPVDSDVHLATRPEVGTPTTRGTLAGEHLFSWLFKKTATNPYAPFAHRPKKKSILAGQLSPSDRLPIRRFRLGGLTLVGLPTETTTVLGHRLRAGVQARHPGPVILCSPCGAYAGYATTAEEYDIQAYEGSSTLFGRHTGRFLASTLAALDTAPPALAPTARFTIHVAHPPIDHVHGQSAELHGAPGAGGRKALARPKSLPGDRFLLSGRIIQTAPLRFGTAPPRHAWLRVEVADRRNGPFSTLEIDGVPVTDIDFVTLVERRVYSNQIHWRWCLELPGHNRLKGHWIRVQFTPSPDAATSGTVSNTRKV